jgi:hypothetical protein
MSSQPNDRQMEPGRLADPAERGLQSRGWRSALSDAGQATLRELNDRVDPQEFSSVVDGVDELADFHGMIAAAAAGTPDSAEALWDTTFSLPLPDSRVLQRGKPFPDALDSRCLVLVPNPYTLSFAAMSIALTSHMNAGVSRDGHRPLGNPTERRLDDARIDTSAGRADGGFEAWGDDGARAAVEVADRIVAAWAIRAQGVDRALQAGRVWLDGGGFEPFQAALTELRNPPLGHDLSFPCLDERQVCIAEFVFTAASLASQLSFQLPTIGAVSPAEQCRTGANTITLLPRAGEEFSDPSYYPNTQPAIDGQPVTVLSWTKTAIQVAIPAGIPAGCHSVGWMHAFPADAVTQLREIGEQCRPWFGGASSLAAAPYTVFVDQQPFSLVGPPYITAFHGPNGSASASVEACTTTTLSWNIIPTACSSTTAQTIVMMWRDGQPFRTQLPLSGSLTVTDQVTRTYTLKTQARLGGTLCGQSDRSVTISRYNMLVAQPQAVTSCVDTNTGIPIRVSVSCPAPVGGVPVTISSSHPNRVKPTSTSIPQGQRTLITEVLTGTDCGPAQLTITAPQHPSVSLTVGVATAPTITSVTPLNVSTCDAVSLTIEGSCLGETATQISAGVWFANHLVSGTITVLTPQTKLRVDLPALPAGSLPIRVSNCGRVGFAPQLLTVTSRTPTITAVTTNPGSVATCSTPTVTIDWTVRYATRVVLTRGASQIADRTYADPCTAEHDTATDHPPSVRGPITYTLTAFNADGATVSSTRTVPMVAPAPLTQAFVVANGSQITVNVFLVNAENPGGSFIGSLAPGQGTTIPVPDCFLRAIISIDPQKVTAHNQTYNTNYSPTSVQTARTSASWTRTTTPYALGLATANPIGIVSV